MYSFIRYVLSNSVSFSSSLCRVSRKALASWLEDCKASSWLARKALEEGTSAAEADATEERADCEEVDASCGRDEFEINQIKE